MSIKQRAKPKNRSGWIMLAITIILYVVIAFLEPSLAFSSLSKSLDILKMITPILLIVLLIMALLGTFINSKSIVKNLGEGSGVRGWIISLAGGVLSHGSTYIWYPILSELRNAGAREGLIVAFFYARAIKLPWVPVMIGYFGFSFTLLLTIYILLGAWIQGLIANKIIIKKKF